MIQKILATTPVKKLSQLKNTIPPRQLSAMKRYAIIFAIAAICLFYLFPIYWMVVSSLKSSGIYSFQPEFIPSNPTLDAYRFVLFNSKFTTFYWNSVIVAVGTILITDAAAVLGGYGLARLNFPFKQGIAKSILFGYMFPPLLLGIPIYLIWNNLALTNSLFGLILAQTAIILPFSTWIMWQFFGSISETYEESAWLSGASRPRAFLEVALPKAKPGLIAITIFAFAISWNDFALALVLLTDLSKQTLPIGILAFVQQNTVQWDNMMAAVTLMSIPPFIVLFTLQQYILKGFSVGGME